MKTAFLKPVKNRIVRDPVTAQPLPAEGAEKPLSSYWLRRLQDGDVIDSKAKPAQKINTEKKG